MYSSTNFIYISDFKGCESTSPLGFIACIGTKRLKIVFSPLFTLPVISIDSKDYEPLPGDLLWDLFYSIFFKEMASLLQLNLAL